MDHLITSALPYISGEKHLGNLVGSMLPADVYARFLRQRGERVLFVCATDEHGTPAEIAAAKAGLPVDAYCNEQHELQAATARDFNLSFDHFGRSSSAENRELTQYFARRLEENGYIEERVTQQMYSRVDGRFLPDRYVEGICPYCGHPSARGDQCENCTRLLDPGDLIEPKSAISGSSDLELRESRHLFLLQSRLQDDIRVWIVQHDEWPTLVRSIALKWLDEGLHDRSITRDLSWGVPVDRPGFEGKVYYVWFDAPIEYIAATKEWASKKGLQSDAWRSWWSVENDVRYVQFMAKDNVPFHTVMFPATIVGSRDDWRLVDYVKGVNWLDYYGDKFSTSSHRGLTMREALTLLPADYWRFYLLANAPENHDVTFMWEALREAINKDLADNFGNFVSRTIKFVTSRLGGTVPRYSGSRPQDDTLRAELFERIAQLEGAWSDIEFRKGIQHLRAAWSLGNAYLDRMAPWKTLQTDPEGAASTMHVALQMVQIFARIAMPLIPEVSGHVLASLGIKEHFHTWPKRDEALVNSAGLPAGRQIADPGVLFPKIDDAQVAAWRSQYQPRSAETT